MLTVLHAAIVHANVIKLNENFFMLFWLKIICSILVYKTESLGIFICCKFRRIIYQLKFIHHKYTASASCKIISVTA